MADVIYLVEMTVYDSGISGTRVLRYCSGVGFVTGPTDTPANALYEPRVVQPCNFTRTAFSDARIMGGTTAGYGEIVLNNADQGLSDFMDYGVDGRACTVLIGPQDGDYPSDFTVFVKGLMQFAEVSASKVTIRLRDNLVLLQLPIQTTLYAGNNVLPNGAEGGAELAGQAKPLTYGRVYHVPAVCVNTASLIYQVHDGAVQAIDGVFDGGVPITASGTDWGTLADLEYSTSDPATTHEPVAGAYSTCKALGLFRLGATPGLRITAHVQGDNSGGYVDTVAGIVKRILTQRAGISAGSLDSSFTALDAAFSAKCGVFVGASGSNGSEGVPQSTPMAPVLVSGQGIGTSLQSVIDSVLLSGGCWLAPTRLGVWQIKQLVAPSSPSATFTDDEIISVERETTSDATFGLPVYFVQLRWNRYPGVLQTSEIAGSISTLLASDYRQEWRIAISQDAAVKTKHLLAASLYRDTCLTNITEAATEAGRVLALHKVRRDFVRAVVRLDATKATIDNGSVIQLQTEKLGYDAGRTFVVVGLTGDGRKDELTLDLWG